VLIIFVSNYAKDNTIQAGVLFGNTRKKATSMQINKGSHPAHFNPSLIFFATIFSRGARNNGERND
tara:strand:- start:124 stop:321 length:198 start_codon:yes stop_codon:yes gene_type:complete